MVAFQMRKPSTSTALLTRPCELLGFRISHNVTSAYNSSLPPALYNETTCSIYRHWVFGGLKDRLLNLISYATANGTL